MYIRGCLASEKEKSSSGFILSSAFFSKINNSTILITTSGLVNNSLESLNHFDYIIRVCLSYFIKLISIRSQRLRLSFEEYVEYFLHCTLEVKFLCLCLYLSLVEQFVALNYCIPNTMRNSSRSTGLIFGIEFESNQNWMSCST